MQTNARRFSQLVLGTFFADNYLINSHLPLVRIQTVTVDGAPQDFSEIFAHSRKDTLQSDDWDKHLEGIKSLCILAGQAREFAVKKNLTEGKTGIVQPDLISSKNIEESLLHNVTSPDTPKKRLVLLEKTDEKIKGLKVDYEQKELLKSPLHPTNSFLKAEQSPAVTPDSPKFPTSSPSKSPTPSSKSRASTAELQSPKFPTASPSKSLSEDKKEPKVELPKKTVNETTKSFITSEKQAVSDTKKEALSPKKPKPLELSPSSSPAPPPVSQSNTEKHQPTASLKQPKQKLIQAKPPNILVYSDSTTTKDHVINSLRKILRKNTYTIYPLSAQQVRSRVWLDNTTLLIVCGSVNGSDVGQIFLDFFFRGGKVLCLCSDLLGHVLPTYHTAEVSESNQTNEKSICVI